MPGAFISSGPSESKNYPGKLTVRVFVACFVAAFGGLIFGYDLGISGIHFHIYIYIYIFWNMFFLHLIIIVLVTKEINMCRWCDFYGSVSEEILS